MQLASAGPAVTPSPMAKRNVASFLFIASSKIEWLVIPKAGHPPRLGHILKYVRASQTDCEVSAKLDVLLLREHHAGLSS